MAVIVGGFVVAVGAYLVFPDVPTRSGLIQAILLPAVIFCGCLVLLETKGDFQARFFRMITFLILPSLLYSYFIGRSDPKLGVSWLLPLINLITLSLLSLIASGAVLVVEKLVSMALGAKK